tara:strand:+ start:178 stop:570 length:393 start_codon:yes stop_codon:yes gene_type:complete
MEKLDELLGIANGVVASTPSPTTPAIPRTQTENEDDDDFKYSRENLYHIIERGQDALDGILQVAKETDHPRAYEVAGQLLKTNADNAEKLVNLQTTKKKVTEVSGPKNVTNALFVGSTAELQKLIKDKNV